MQLADPSGITNGEEKCDTMAEPLRNILIEDLINVFEGLGETTGVNIDALRQSARDGASFVGAEFGRRGRDGINACLSKETAE